MTMRAGRQFLRFCAAGLAAVIAFSPVIVPERAAAQTAAATDFTSLAQLLRAGGLNILVRHGATNSNQADTDPFHLADHICPAE